ncbi:MAG: OmpA family protein [Deltaproteobacteria bacterium]|nr:OmpA family protein [Deltaproteobacteria bacterium]
MKSFSLVRVVVLLTLLSGVSKAEQVVNVHLNDKVASGQQPSLTISVHRDLKALTLDLRRDDGKKVNQTLTNIPRNSKRTFKLPQKSGRHRYKGSLDVKLAGGDGGAMKLDFVAEVVPSLGLSVSRDELDLVEHSVLLNSKRALVKVDYEITAETGARIGSGSHKIEKAERRVKIEWRQKEGKVLKIKLVAYDVDGLNEEIELIPWTYNIPHEEVEFETGKWDIRDSEVPKLNKSYKLLIQGLKKYGKLLEVKLYIAGYTDTVAAADYNLGLSMKRALSIARYYRSKGFKHPIYYQGYGERGLKVQTPDETDEPRNRRAEYVLAAEPPGMNVSGSSAGWKRLKGRESD